MESNSSKLLDCFFEYCLMVPANRIGYNNGMNGFQLKITQEIITLVVFSFFAVLYLKEPFQSKYLISFLFILGQFILHLKNKIYPYTSSKCVIFKQINPEKQIAITSN